MYQGPRGRANAYNTLLQQHQGVQRPQNVLTKYANSPLDIVIAAGATADSADSFSSGTWTAPIAGW